MMRIVLTLIFFALSTPLSAEECAVENLEKDRKLVLHSTGAIGYVKGSTTRFVGITTQGVVKKQEAAIFTQPRTYIRGRKSYCVMNRAGTTDLEDGAVYDHIGSYLGRIDDESQIIDRDGNTIATYTKGCEQFPVKLRRKIIGGAGLHLGMFRQSDKLSNYAIGFNPAACSWSYHPGRVRPLVIIEPF